MEEEYFDAYSDLDVHYLMLKDKPRTLAYKNAIQPGIFKDKVVLDVGCGTGILSMFSAKIGGAKKVYAVEASNTYKIAEQLIADNNLKNIIVLHGEIEKVKIPEQVDVIVSEWMGFYLVHESMLDSVLFARNRYLKTGGWMFPSHAKLFACPVSTPKAFEKVHFFKDVYGFDFSRLQDTFYSEIVSKPYVESLFPKNLLTNPKEIHSFDLKTVSLKELKEIKCFTKFTIREKSVMNGICIWFSVSFENTGVELNTSPNDEETHWKQTTILLPSSEGYEVSRDDQVPCSIILSQDEENHRNYNISVSLTE